MSDFKSQIKFGTDGWRAVISDTFTFENVRIVAQAVADWVNKDNPQILLKALLQSVMTTVFFPLNMPRLLPRFLRPTALKHIFRTRPYPPLL